MTRVEQNYDVRAYNLERAVGTGASGSLSTPGAGKVITLSPFPWGLSTTNPVKITDGVTTEIVTPSAVSGIAGSTSGTITVNTANGFSGGWSIRSATGGIQEAIETGRTTGEGFTAIVTEPVVLDAQVNVNAEGAKIIGTSRNNANPLVYRATGTLFHVTVGGVEIAGLALRGGRTVAQPVVSDTNIGIVISGPSAPRGHYHDLMFDLMYGGILHSGGFHSKFTNIWGRNLQGYVFKHASGIGPFVDTMTYDTDPPFDVAEEGGIIVHADGGYFYNIDILHCRHGILIQPTVARMEWTFIYDARFDQNYTSGVYIHNDTIHAIEGVYMHDVWSASAGINGTVAGVAPTSGTGFVVEGPGPIDEVIWLGGQIFNNNDQNVRIHGGNHVEIRGGTRINGCNLDNKVNIDQVYVESPSYVLIDGVEFHSRPGSGTLRSAILAAANTGDLIIRNCRFEGTFTGGTPVVNLASSPSAVQVYGFSRGADDVPLIIASAATMNLAPQRLFQVTGTTTISTILPVYEGRIVVLQKIDAGALAFDTTGNLQSPTGTPGTILTLNNGENVRCEFAGSKWLIHR